LATHLLHIPALTNSLIDSNYLSLSQPSFSIFRVFIAMALAFASISGRQYIQIPSICVSCIL
jgi:hypothetical protein